MDIFPCNFCPCDICPYLSCHWPNFETCLANYYPFTLDNLRQLSNGHFSMQHLSLRHLSISGVSQLSLTKFWPNFKGPWENLEHIPTVTVKFVKNFNNKKFRQNKTILPKKNNIGFLQPCNLTCSIYYIFLQHFL